MSPPTGGWEVRRKRGDAASLHAEPLPDHPGRAVWVLEATAQALVLGSTQGDDLVDRAAAAARGAEVARRRSGGGVVWVDPATTVWVDVIVPAGDALWDSDIGRAAHWLGLVWRSAL
ncbi:MAG: lipoyl protein ligase domain-containing protein, partial [Acidimicrobiales bacterium]